MKKCSKCWMRYCSNACTLRHWQVHKPICKNLASWLETHGCKNRKSRAYAKKLHKHITPGMGFCFLSQEQYDTCLRVTMGAFDQFDIRLADPANRLRGAPSGGAARRGAPWGERGGGRPAEGPGGGGEAPEDFTKPRQTIQSSGILDKAPETLYKSFEYYTKTQNIKQNLTISNKNPKY